MQEENRGSLTRTRTVWPLGIFHYGLLVSRWLSGVMRILVGKALGGLRSPSLYVVYVHDIMVLHQARCPLWLEMSSFNLMPSPSVSPLVLIRPVRSLFLPRV